MSEPLYHVTYYNRLAGIAEHGLRPGHEASIGSAAYDAHRANAIFVTEFGGVPFWMERAEQWAEQRYDDPAGLGFVPVALKFPESALTGELFEDDPGTRDARHPAYRCSCEVPPDNIEVFAGRNWIAISDWNTIDPMIAVDDEGYLLEKSPLKP